MVKNKMVLWNGEYWLRFGEWLHEEFTSSYFDLIEAFDKDVNPGSGMDEEMFWIKIGEWLKDKKIYDFESLTKEYEESKYYREGD